ncbi:hypothetical protein [Thermococcus sp.]
MLSGKTGDVERTAEELSPCGLKNGRKVEWKTPEETLSLVVSELGGSFALKPLSRPIIWALTGGRFELGENLSLTILVYGTREQCHYARYLPDTTQNTMSICIKSKNYFVVVAVRGKANEVRTILSSIKQPKKI